MTLEERIERLEKNAARWRGRAVFFGFCLVVAMAYAFHEFAAQSAVADEREQPAAAKAIRTQKLELVDDHGDVVAWMALVNGRPYFEIGRLGEPQVTIDAQADAAQLLITSGKSGTVGLTSSVESGPSFRCMSDDQGVFISPTYLSLSKQSAKGQQLTKRAVRGERLTEADQREMTPKRLVFLTESDSGGGLIEVSNSLGTITASVQTDRTNQGAVYVYNVNGQVRGVLPNR